jgi:molybdate transport system substrate-binding protein
VLAIICKPEAIQQELIHMLRRIAPLLYLATLGVVPAAAQAETIKVLTGGAFKQVVMALVPGFEARTGHKVEVQNDTAGALQKRIAGGEAFDLAIITPPVLQALAKQRQVVEASIAPLAKVAIGVAVKTGAPAPAITTVDEFKQAVLGARKVAYIDPAAGGSSGIYLDGLFQRMGIADAVRAKAVLVPGGLVADRLVTGEADLAIHQISEIIPVKGVTLVGPLPEAIQNYTTYAGAVGGHAAHRDAAQAFLATLSGPEAAEVLRGKGMMPAR